jgi:hypothetical protein
MTIKCRDFIVATTTTTTTTLNGKKYPGLSLIKQGNRVYTFLKKQKLNIPLHAVVALGEEQLELLLILDLGTRWV